MALAGLLAAALPAAAQTPCTGVCIGYAAASGVAGVPLSPAAMLLLSLLVAGAGYVAMRRRSGLVAFVLAVLVAVSAATTDIRQSIAAAVYEVVLASGGFAAIALPGGYSGPVDVRNTLPHPVTITSITVGAGFVLGAGSTLHAGAVIPA